MTALAWIRKNLMATPVDAAVTLACLYFLWMVVPPVLSWGVLDATWFEIGRAHV